MLVAILGIIIFILICVVVVLFSLVRKMQLGMKSIYKRYKDAYNEVARIKAEMK